MAGGPLFPYSAVPTTSGKVYPDIMVGGTNSRREEGLGVIASLDANATYRLHWKMPPTLPSGTCKLVLHARANATSGAAKVNPTWGSCAVEEDPDLTTLTGEGTGTITWSTGDSYQIKELKVTLDADTVTASETIVMSLVFETTSWTLAAKSVWQAFIIWE